MVSVGKASSFDILTVLKFNPTLGADLAPVSLLSI